MAASCLLAVNVCRVLEAVAELAQPEQLPVAALLVSPELWTRPVASSESLPERSQQ